MSDPPKSTFAKRIRAAKPRERRYDVRDDVTPGLFLRVLPTGARSFALDRMTRGRRRFTTLGRADAMTVPEARREARIAIARHGEIGLAEARRRARTMLARIRAGGNPADDIQREKKTPTLRAFADEHLRRSEPHWKPSGRRAVRIHLKARILPAFGRRPLDAIGPEDVAAWFDAASRDKPGAANRAFEILRAMMNRAEEWGLRERGSNPCFGIARNPSKQVVRCLDTDELARLVRALDARATQWPEAVAAIRLLALTGCRRREVLDLRWRNIGADSLNLEDSKTAPRSVPLGEAARAHIAALPGAGDRDAFLFPRHGEGRGEYSLIACWRAVCEDAKLSRLRLHDLRHTAASQAVMSGEGLSLVGRLLWRHRHRTTARAGPISAVVSEPFAQFASGRFELAPGAAPHPPIRVVGPWAPRRPLRSVSATSPDLPEKQKGRPAGRPVRSCRGGCGQRSAQPTMW